MNNDDLSDKKLKELLHNSNSSEAFKVPEGYFEDLSAKITSSINSLPDLTKQSSEQPFTVPADYFEKLPAEINHRILNKRERSESWWSWFLRPAKLVPSLLTIALVIGSYLYFTKTQQIEFNSSEVAIEDIDDSQYLQSISDDDLIEFLASEQDDKVTDEYDQYLLDNDFDITQIENNL